jgi:hypothetical protein
MSAPMAPPQDFTNAYNHGLNISPSRKTSLEGAGQHQHHGHEPAVQEQPVGTNAFMHQGGDYSGQKRKRAYSAGRAYEGQ